MILAESDLRNQHEHERCNDDRRGQISEVPLVQHRDLLKRIHVARWRSPQRQCRSSRQTAVRSVQNAEASHRAKRGAKEVPRAGVRFDQVAIDHLVLSGPARAAPENADAGRASREAQDDRHTAPREGCDGDRESRRVMVAPRPDERRQFREKRVRRREVVRLLNGVEVGDQLVGRLIPVDG